MEVVVDRDSTVEEAETLLNSLLSRMPGVKVVHLVLVEMQDCIWPNASISFTSLRAQLHGRGVELSISLEGAGAGIALETFLPDLRDLSPGLRSFDFLLTAEPIDEVDLYRDFSLIELPVCRKIQLAMITNDAVDDPDAGEDIHSFRVIMRYLRAPKVTELNLDLMAFSADYLSIIMRVIARGAFASLEEITGDFTVLYANKGWEDPFLRSRREIFRRFCDQMDIERISLHGGHGKLYGPFSNR